MGVESRNHIKSQAGDNGGRSYKVRRKGGQRGHGELRGARPRGAMTVCEQVLQREEGWRTRAGSERRRPQQKRRESRQDSS